MRATHSIWREIVQVVVIEGGRGISFKAKIYILRSESLYLLEYEVLKFFFDLERACFIGLEEFVSQSVKINQAQIFKKLRSSIWCLQSFKHILVGFLHHSDHISWWLKTSLLRLSTRRSSNNRREGRGLKWARRRRIQWIRGWMVVDWGVARGGRTIKTVVFLVFDIASFLNILHYFQIF